MTLNIAGIKVIITKNVDKIIFGLSTIDEMVDIYINLDLNEAEQICEALQNEKSKVGA